MSTDVSEVHIAYFLLDLFHDPEDGGDMFFRNIGPLRMDCTTYLKREYSSTNVLLGAPRLYNPIKT
jgi:hypothetical protein